VSPRRTATGGPASNWLADRIRRATSAIAPRGGLRRGVVVLAGGHVLAAVIVAATYPALTRLYSPGNFGAFAAAVSLLTLVLTITCLTYDQAIPLPEKDETAADLVILSLICTVGVTALCTFGMLFFGRRLLGYFDAQSLASYWWLLALAQLTGGLYITLTGWAIRKRDFNGLAFARLGQAIFTSAVQVLTGLVGAASAGLLLGDGAGRAAAGGRLSARARKELRASARELALPRLRSTALRYRRFPLIGSWPTLINSIGFEAPLLLLVAFYGTATGGLFAFAQRMIGAPVALVVLAVGQVFVAEAAERARDESADLVQLYRRTLKKLALLAAPLMLFIAIAAQLLVAPVFGEEWQEAGTFITILTPLYAMQLLSSPLGGTLAVLERQDLALIREVARIALLTLAIVTARELALSATWAVILLSTAGTLAYILYGVISWHALQVDATRRRFEREATAHQP
jgi:O-antigen/teichoic acid export membrane protein